MSIKFDNIRFGHACNSSSTHSIVMMDDVGFENFETEFGWDFFTVEPANIHRYLAATIASQYEYSSRDREKLRDIMMRTLGVHISNDSNSPDYGYVDHQYILNA